MTLWTVAPQTSGSMEFSRQEYWSGLPFPPRYFPCPGSNPSLLCLLHWQEDFYHCTTWEAPKSVKIDVNMLIPEPHLDLVRSESLVMGLWEVILLTFAQIIFQISFELRRGVTLVEGSNFPRVPDKMKYPSWHSNGKIPSHCVFE